MGSRKDILKNLGIPEYPWSSDDEEPPAETRPAVPRPTGQPPAPVSSAPLAGSAPLAAPRPPQTNSLLFLSMLNTNQRAGPVASNPGFTSSRTSEPYMSRAAHTPAADVVVRVGEDRMADDIRRMLNFRRLTRNMTVLRGAGFRGFPENDALPRVGFRGFPEDHALPRVPMPRIYARSAGTVVPSEANSAVTAVSPQQRIPAHWHRRSSRAAPINYQMELQPSGTAIPRRRRARSDENRNSEDEDAEGAPSSLAGAAGSSEPRVEYPAMEPVVEEEAQGSSNDTSGTGISLEEEIVEIADEPASDLVSTSDPNLASTSRPDEVDAPQSETQLVAQQGVKRKRRSSSSDRPTEPFTVTEFNQSLLRLLECPVCLEWMEPPMSQCRRGHLVCNRCRTRLASCPVCRTTFSSVRNRAMEGVAEMLRYPCRHGCGREVRLRRRTPHEASCAARKYACPAPLCEDKMCIPRDELYQHFHSKHPHMVKLGPRHRFGIKVNSEAHDTWLILALDEFFHVKVDVDIRTWGVVVYVAYIGPKCNAKNYTYEVAIDGQHNGRKMIYRRATHSDLESSSHNVSRQDCFHLSLDQAMNFIRFKNRHCDAERSLVFSVEVSKIEPPPARDDSDS